MPKQNRAKLNKKKASTKPVKRVSLARRIIRFVPALAFFATAFVINLAPAVKARSTHDVLGYATSITAGDSLASTNAQRAAGSIANLTLNSKLSSAAQTKANDMVARDY